MNELCGDQRADPPANAAQENVEEEDGRLKADGEDFANGWNGVPVEPRVGKARM